MQHKINLKKCSVLSNFRVLDTLVPGHVALDDPALDVVAPLGHHLPARGVDEVALEAIV